jgi:uncharacterized protein YndB with AHSA1/START domain
MLPLRFDSFTKKIYIKTSRPKLYLYWATTQGICSWFLRNASYTSAEGILRPIDETISAGDSYVWEWHNWNGQESGKVLQANGTDFIEFTFAGTCIVSVHLEEKDTAVLVTLRQYEIPTDEDSKMKIYNGCSNGWTFWLANLKAYLEYGIHLNETEFDLTEIPQAGHIFVNM